MSEVTVTLDVAAGDLWSVTWDTDDFDPVHSQNQDFQANGTQHHTLLSSLAGGGTITGTTTPATGVAPQRVETITGTSTGLLGAVTSLPLSVQTSWFYTMITGSSYVATMLTDSLQRAFVAFRFPDEYSPDKGWTLTALELDATIEVGDVAGTNAVEVFVDGLANALPLRLGQASDADVLASWQGITSSMDTPAVIGLAPANATTHVKASLPTAFYPQELLEAAHVAGWAGFGIGWDGLTIAPFPITVFGEEVTVSASATLLLPVTLQATFTGGTTPTLYPPTPVYHAAERVAARYR